MKIIITVLLFLVPAVQARLLSPGFYATINGTVDYLDFKKPNLDTLKHKATGFGVQVSSGLRFGSRIALGPFVMFTSAVDNNNDAVNYLFSGYGGEGKLRISPFNFKGGYGAYNLRETGTGVETEFTGTGWHGGAGLEFLVGPGVTFYLDGIYREINFAEYSASMEIYSAVLGFASYF